jgi:alcohol dehydrogenase class IV
MPGKTTTMAEIRIPPMLRIGGGSFATVATLLPRLRAKHPLIVTDPFLMKTQLADRLASQIRGAGFAVRFSTRQCPIPRPRWWMQEYAGSWKARTTAW